METRVVNIRREPYDIYIGRPSKWGNPFRIGRDGTRDEVIMRHEEWLLGVIPGPNGELPPSLTDAKNELEGKRLGCFCSPRPCHGDNYVMFLGEE